MTSTQPTGGQAYPDRGFVYVLTNAAMPGFVKIGLTRRDDISDRLRQLDTTGVALPFECYYAAQVPDCGKLEAVLHQVFGEKRIRPNREFFRADPDLARLIIDLVKIDVKPVSDAEQGITPGQRADIEAEKSRRSPRIDFERLGLEPGAVLTLTKDPSVTCTVSSKARVLYLGQELSPSQAALRAINSLGYNWPAASGSEHWAHDGTKLSALSQADDAGDEVDVDA